MRPIAYNQTPVASTEFQQATEKFEDEYKHRILLCLLGETPAVITETLSLLLKEGIETAGQLRAFRPTELRIITTGDGADGLNASLFLSWLGSCLKAWGYTPQNQLVVKLQLIRLTANGPADRSIKREGAADAPYTFEDINLIGDSSSKGVPEAPTDGMDRRGRAPESIGDVRSSVETEHTANYLLEQMDELVKIKGSAIHASIAGGRKSMGALLTQIMSLLGREQDTISHVLTHKTLEPRYEKVAAKKDREKWLNLQPWLSPQEPNRLDESPDNRIFELSKLDFVRLEPMHKSPRLTGESYSDLVRRINARLHGEISFVIGTDARRICPKINLAEKYDLNLSPGSRALLLWLVCQTDMLHRFNEQTDINKLKASWRDALMICGANAVDKSVRAITSGEKWGHMLEEKSNQLHKELENAGFPKIFEIEMTGVTVIDKTRVWKKPNIYLRKIDSDRFDKKNIQQPRYKELNLGSMGE